MGTRGSRRPSGLLPSLVISVSQSNPVSRGRTHPSQEQKSRSRKPESRQLQTKRDTLQPFDCPRMANTQSCPTDQLASRRSLCLSRGSSAMFIAMLGCMVPQRRQSPSPSTSTSFQETAKSLSLRPQEGDVPVLKPLAHPSDRSLHMRCTARSCQPPKEQRPRPTRLGTYCFAATGIGHDSLPTAPVASAPNRAVRYSKGQVCARIAPKWLSIPASEMKGSVYSGSRSRGTASTRSGMNVIRSRHRTSIPSMGTVARITL